MEVNDKPQLERAELEAILQSGIFARAPNLASFLTYICERHIAGRADEIKEYNIATEALGRHVDFDQKKDSIVRVEAHKLRKRLAEYYAGPGGNHEIRIVIPNGQYAPMFVVQEHGHLHLDATGIPLLIEDERPPAIAVAESQTRRWAAIVSTALVCAAVVASILWIASKRTNLKKAGGAGDSHLANEVWSGTSTEPLPGEVRFLAGYHGPSFQDRQGRTWGADAYYNGGESIAIPAQHFVLAQPQPGFVRSERSGKFRYDIPLREGIYELHLLFAETDYGLGNPKGGSESDRLFGVSINGRLVMDNFDVIADAGGSNRLHVRVFKDMSPMSDGKLHLLFDPVTAAAFLNGLEIVPTVPGKMRPIRMVAQQSSITDEFGRVWLADEHVIGGHVVMRRDSVTNVKEKSIYDGERYGNFAYRIPLAPGKYRLTLHFAETWFGTPQTKVPGAASRLFNVFANGTALLREFDIAAAAGGSNLALVKTFDNIQPNAQGQLVLEFIPLKNYACVNAIEVTEAD